jgi:hypothetical protein
MRTEELNAVLTRDFAGGEEAYDDQYPAVGR